LRENEFDVAYRVLDDDLIDSEGRRCGKVDDIEIEGSLGAEAHLSAIVSGPGAWSGRLPRALQPLAQRLFGGRVVRVPWSEVDDITAVVTLKRPARDLRLGRGDDHARRLFSWAPED
jgi:sporulation protein YlmC with PRC-barrel domain